MAGDATSRRDFLGRTLLGSAALATLGERGLGGRTALAQDKPDPEKKEPLKVPTTFVHPRERLKKIGKNKVQMWVVSYANQNKEKNADLAAGCLADIDASFAGGADAVVLINEFCSLQEFEPVLERVREKHPKAALGVNYLGDDKDPYGYQDSFRLASKFKLEVVWTDFSGIDLIEKHPPGDLHKIKGAQPPDVFYVSGIHMKYSKLLDPKKTIEESALQAMGWVDGITVTGPKTGVATDPERVHRARSVIGNYPLGVASGTSVESVQPILGEIDYCLVHTSISNGEKHRIVEAKVKALRAALGGP